VYGHAFPTTPLMVVKLFISVAEMGNASLRAGISWPYHLYFNYQQVEKASPAGQEGTASAFLLSQSCLFPFSSPFPGSLTLPYASSVCPKRCVGEFYPNPKNHVSDLALLLTAPAAFQSWGVH